MGNEIDRLRQQIEDLKTQVANLQQSDQESIYRGLFENSHAVMLLIDPETAAIRDANPAACAYYRWSREELKALRIEDINIPARDETFTQMQLAQTEKRKNFFFKHRRADGSIRDVEIYSGPLTIKGQTLIHSIVHDITDRVHAQKLQAESERRYSTLMGNLPGMVYRCLNDEFWTMKFLSKGCFDLTGYPRDYLLENHRMNYAGLIHPEDRQMVWDRVQAAIGRRKRFNLIYRIHCAGGDEKWVMETGQGIFSEKNELVAIEGLITNITELKQAEESLRESKHRFRNLVESAPIGIFTTSSNGTALSINLAMARILDCPSQEEALNRYGDLKSKLYVYAERRDEFLRLMRSSGRVEDFEYQARTATGRIIWVSMNARISERRDDGSFIIEGFATDITERKRAEEELRDSEERHRQIVEASTDAILVRSGDRIIYANPAAVGLFRASKPEALIGKRYLDLIPPDEQPESIERIKKGIQESWIAPLREHKILTMDGHTVHVESTGVPVRYKGETQLFGVFRDITERKQVDEELRETERKYRELAESLPQVIFEVDSKGNLIYLNQTGFALFGYTPDDLAKGFNVIEAFIAEDRDRVASDIMLNVQGQKLGRQEYTAVKKDGTQFPVGVHANRVIREQKAIGIRGILIDFSPIKRAEEEKKKLEIQLQQAQKMEAIGALAGGIAHDFNNILSAIIGYTELAMLNEGAEHCTSELNEALKAANRAKDLVRQILAFSRQTDEVRMPVRIALVAKEAVKFLRATIPATIEINTRIDEKSGAVLANSVELHQIIMNLCTNAQHAIGQKAGLLEIEVKNTDIGLEQKNDLISLQEGSYVRISVKDSGYGMTPDVIERIFDPYFTTKEKGVGTGLGLAVVHGIVRKSGGAIKVESEPGKGTTFHIYLPKAETYTPIKAEEPTTVLRGSEKILFVDDEKMLVAAGQKALQHLGYTVVSRTSPIEALELFKAKTNHFDLVITDQTMPGMTGDVLARELMRIRPDLPVIICTGYSQTVDEKKAEQAGIKALVMKPILINELANAIRMALDKE